MRDACAHAADALARAFAQTIPYIVDVTETLVAAATATITMLIFYLKLTLAQIGNY